MTVTRYFQSNRYAGTAIRKRLRTTKARMRQVILFVAVLVGTAISLNAQTAPDAAQLTKLLNDFLAGAGRNDPAAHDRFWASDLIYTRSAGMRTNKEELMKGVRSAPPRKEGDPVTVFTAEDVRIQQYGNAAVVAFKLVSTTTKADGTKIVANNLNTGTFIKRDGKWQVVAWQSTTVPEPKPVALSSQSVLITSTRTYLKGPRG